MNLDNLINSSEKELIKEVKRNENNKNETQKSMDWI